MTTLKAAIELLEQEIAIRQEAVRAMRKVLQPDMQDLQLGNAANILGAPLAVWPATVSVTAVPTDNPVRIRITGAKAKPGREAKAKPSKPSGLKEKLTDRVLQACEACTAQPFNQNDIARQMGIDGGQARGALSYLAKKGALKVVTPGRPNHPGQYALAAGRKYGPAAPNKPKRVTVPGLDVDEASLESKLETAVTERDRAVAAEQHTLARILEDKVNDLQRRIGEAK